MKKLFSNVNERWKEYALAGSVCILVFAVLTNLGKFFSGLSSFLDIFVSVFLGFVIAYIFNPLAVIFREKLFRKIHSHKLKWLFSVLLAIIIILAFFGLILNMLIPQVIRSAKSLFDNFDRYLERLSSIASNAKGPLKPVAQHFIGPLASRDGFLDTLGDLAEDNMNSIISKTTHFGTKALNWLVGLILSIYILLAKDSIKRTFSKFFSLALSPEQFYRAKLVIDKFNGIFSTYIVCQLLDSLIIGILTFIFMLITGMPDAVFISFIAAITNLAPTFGPIIGGGIGGIILLLLKPSAVIPFLIFTAVIQIADAYLIKPRLFGNALNVPGVLILISIVIFGRMLGVTGMLIAIPCAAIITFLYDETLIPWMQLKRDLAQYNSEKGPAANSVNPEEVQQK